MTPPREPPVWRSLLYVPGNVPRFVDRAHERGADAVLLDLEDSVPPAEKARARDMLADSVAKVGRGGADVLVRINRPLSLAVRDLEAAILPGVAGIFVTKTEGPEHLSMVDELVGELEAARGIAPGTVRLVGMIEHPRTLPKAEETARASPRVAALTLGGEDFALEAWMAPGEETLEWPKRRIAFAAHAAGIQPLGILGTVADYSDVEAYRRMAERSRRFGFFGATCVHPALVPALNEAFSPAPAEVAFANRVVEADRAMAAAGRGSFQIDGKMIDIPVVERARRLLARHEAIERRKRRA